MSAQKGLRAPERVFRVVLWIVAVIFASFLIGLGSLVVEDLPKVDTRVVLDDFLDKPRAAALDAKLRDDQIALKAAADRLASQRLRQQSTHAAYDSAKGAFDNWVATRTSTQRSDQDPEVLARTKELDTLIAASRQADSAAEEIDAERVKLEQDAEALGEARRQLDDAAAAPYQAALRRMELHVFLIRLAITLPPLALAAWLFVKQRKSRWWPFVWGFVFFAAFTFFVELVPYLPSYGGYVRYLVGIVVTVLVGRYAIVGMQRYLERQRAAEAQSEVVRRQSLSYEHAIKSTNAGVCPGCERGFKVQDGEVNFCMHCGMTLFDHCPVCTKRKNAFFHFCPSCGSGKVAASDMTPPSSATVVMPTA